MTQGIESRLEEYMALLKGAGLSVDTKQEAIAEIDEVRADLNRTRTDAGFERYLVEYIQREADRFPEDRDDPVCRCGSQFCPLKNGDLPPQIRNADDLQAALLSFIQDHRGRQLVLEEAHDDWESKQATVKKRLELCIVSMRADKPLSEMKHG